MSTEQLLKIFEEREPDPLGFVYLSRTLVWQLEALMHFGWPPEWEWQDVGRGKVRIGRDTLLYRIKDVRQHIARRAKARLLS